MHYSDLRRSGGAIDDEAGVKWELVGDLDQVPGEFSSQGHGSVDLGLALPAHASAWLLSAAGFAGPHLFGYLNARTGSFSYGLALMMVSALAGGLLILCAPRSARAPVR